MISDWEKESSGERNISLNMWYGNSQVNRLKIFVDIVESHSHKGSDIWSNWFILSESQIILFGKKLGLELLLSLKEHTR